MNGACLVRPRTGVGQTIAHLHNALCRLFLTDHFHLYPGPFLTRVGQAVLPRAHRSARPRRRRSWLSIRRWTDALLLQGARRAYRLHFRLQARWGRFDLYHEPNFIPLPTDLPTVVTVHDLSVLTHPHWHPLERVRHHEREFHRGLARAAHVITVSEAVRREIIELLGLPPSLVTAIPNGVDEAYAPQAPEALDAFRQKARLPGNYLLAVGTIEPRKNLGMLMRAYCDLPGPLRLECPLILAGGWGWNCQAERHYYETVGRHRGVRHLGYVPAEDLPRLYAGAKALLFPSHYEGFGLPPLEMLACGGRVIASDTPAVREVVGPHAILLNPNDTPAWRNAMQAVLRNASSPAVDFAAVRHARGFRWEKSAQATHAVYRQVLGLEDDDASLSSSFTPQHQAYRNSVKEAMHQRRGEYPPRDQGQPAQAHTQHKEGQGGWPYCGVQGRKHAG